MGGCWIERIDPHIGKSVLVRFNLCSMKLNEYLKLLSEKEM